MKVVDLITAGIEAYENGKYDEAKRILTECAEAGDPEAMMNLGLGYDGEILEGGGGFGADAGNAFFWYKKAAENGFDDALIPLYVCYDEGIGTKVNPDKAKELKKKLKTAD